MSFHRYAVITNRSGVHSQIASSEIESYVFNPPGATPIPLTVLTSELASAMQCGPEEVTHQIAACNPGTSGVPQTLAPGQLMKIRTEVGEGEGSVLDDVPLAGGRYLKFLKWAIRGAQAAADAYRNPVSAEQRDSWKRTLEANRSEILKTHSAILQKVGMPLSENSFESVVNKIIPEFLRKKGISSHVVQIIASDEGFIAFRSGNLKVLTDARVS